MLDSLVGWHRLVPESGVRDVMSYYFYYYHPFFGTYGEPDIR